MLVIQIKADYNDADYITDTIPYDLKTADLLSRFADVYKEEKGVDLYSALDSFRDTSPYKNLTDEDWIQVRDLIPWDGQSGQPCHTIKSIKILEEYRTIL